MPTTIIAYHGWGFDQTCWQPWKDLLAQRGEDLLISDRGYFNSPALPIAANTNHRTILFVHSYGLHLCPSEQLHRADLLVVFSSFLSFHPQLEAKKRRSLLMLSQMMTQFKANPQTVLEAFRTKCYHPVLWERSPDSSKAINSELLLHDLESLSACLLDVSLLKKIPKILILHGVQDRIVSVEKGRELSAHLPDNSQYIEIEQAGHGLPFTHIDVCWSWLCRRLGAE
ncbi:MAG: alpha/beta hydrolase [Timaviella obliquedivisa GSE-PSE-MK23-08B]|jgi:pimeloyl-[acyl-carrier protein] methyl ester esterase|nr:alpha/beta hydrolase [Timaviella obliquedivisa GSE-PSE-MK23-08B]